MQKVFAGENSALFVGQFPDIDQYEAALWKLDLHERPTIRIFGKECHQARDVGFYSHKSKGYRYSGKVMPSRPLTPELQNILSVVNDTFDDHFNGILVNRYNNGTQSIGAHSDDERGLGTSGVVSLSVGATRKFRIRTRTTKERVFDCLLSHGCLMHMQGDFQSEFTHEIPKELRIKEPRLSLTFRHHTE